MFLSFQWYVWVFAVAGYAKRCFQSNESPDIWDDCSQSSVTPPRATTCTRPHERKPSSHSRSTAVVNSGIVFLVIGLHYSSS